MKHEDEVHMKRASAGLALDESRVILLFLLLGDYLVITRRAPENGPHRKDLNTRAAGRARPRLTNEIKENKTKMKGTQAKAEEHVIVSELPRRYLRSKHSPISN